MRGVMIKIAKLFFLCLVIAIQSIFMQTVFAQTVITQTVATEQFSLSSKDIRPWDFMSAKHEYTGFGCVGGNMSPQLSWSDAPDGTKSFAITAYDPDAPTGSGWWHWQVINIPAEVTELATNTGSATKKLHPEGSQQMRNDYGKYGFGGACPPQGAKAHRYEFTVHALSVEKLDLPKDASAALTGYMIKANTIATAQIVSLYKRHSH